MRYKNMTQDELLAFNDERLKQMNAETDDETISDAMWDIIKKNLYHNFSFYSTEFIFEMLSHIGCCPALVNDDNGKWAVSGDGFSQVVTDDELIDGSIVVMVDAEMWDTSVRGALQKFVKSYVKIDDNKID